MAKSIAPKKIKIKAMDKVEKLRALLCELVELKGPTHKTVIEISSMLDVAVIEMMEQNKKNNRLN